MPPREAKKGTPKASKQEKSSSATDLLKQFYAENEKGPYFSFYKQFQRREAVFRGSLKENAENLEYGSVYKKWVDLQKGLVEIPLAQFTIACKFFFLPVCFESRPV